MMISSHVSSDWQSTLIRLKLIYPRSELCQVPVAVQRSCGQGYVFLLVSVILLMGGGFYPSMHCRWYPSMPCSRSVGGGVSQHALQVSRPTPKGEVEGDQVQAHSQGGSWGGSSPGPGSRRLLLRTVRILLECILVLQSFEGRHRN